uniref:NADH-ubiquinone oxidoreductase chain 3 n=1 Tax=Auritibicen japonicus TaxID=1761006 RepID=A0A344ALD0_9HEMI|nr:NADH dehydrogenase subunit 3 [Auritibicen japonicus]
MKYILLYSIVLMFILLVLMVMLYFVSTKSMMDREKNSPFECGFDPFDSSRIPFSSHFFLIAVIFLVFDVELVIIMPMMIIIPMVNLINLYVIMLTFLIVLILGLYHEWNNKMFDWM